MRIDPRHLGPLALTASCIYASNTLFRIAQGIATASASAGWQPTQQIFTFGLGLLLKALFSDSDEEA